jgi:large subunit ribosomal protein L7/L12
VLACYSHASLTHDDVIRYLESLPSEELGKLADEVLARVGAPPIAPPVRPERYDSTMGEDLSRRGLPSSDVVLRDYGPNKLAVIRAVRNVLGPHLGLDDAKRLVESAPVKLREGLWPEEAQEIAEELRGAGAVVEVR